MDDVTLKQAAAQAVVAKELLRAEKRASLDALLRPLNPKTLALLGLIVGVPAGMAGGYLHHQARSLGHEADLQRARTRYYNRMADKVKTKLDRQRELDRERV